MGKKTISIDEEKHKRLRKIGAWGEPMDDIIGRLLENYEGKKK